MLTEPIAVTLQVVSVLEALDIPYFIGGSLASAEDIILAKLQWYRLGGEVSERQWNDVRNIFKVQGGRLDRSYLETWADGLGVADLWQRLSKSET